ncbi:hypothetical protein RB195_006880 [Necator americanus]|uniref:Uncharacterized protein n=1 Tax=Necator americanus TaxID=51031 RepID=A0ABR1BW08_NECAM
MLETKNFFRVRSDCRDLHRIVLGQHPFNVVSLYSGFDKSMVSVEYYVWAYDVKHRRQAPGNIRAVLAQSRISRALENHSTYFFNAARFVFASADTCQKPVFGIALGLVRRRNRVTHLRAVFEVATDAVSLTSTLSDFRLEGACKDQFFSARTR